jgi:hypothetical protein
MSPLRGFCSSEETGIYNEVAPTALLKSEMITGFWKQCLRCCHCSWQFVLLPQCYAPDKSPQANSPCQLPMTLTLILFLVFFAMLALVIWRMWLTGEITGFAPRTHRERLRLCWLVAAAVNFLAFLVHGALDRGAFAFPAGGRLADGVYLVTQHGRDFALTPARYLFSFWHGVLFVVVHLVCMVAIRRLKNAEA